MNVSSYCDMEDSSKMYAYKSRKLEFLLKPANFQFHLPKLLWSSYFKQNVASQESVHLVWGFIIFAFSDILV